jgi:hypothetical protein
MPVQPSPNLGHLEPLSCFSPPANSSPGATVTYHLPQALHSVAGVGGGIHRLRTEWKPPPTAIERVLTRTDKSGRSPMHSSASARTASGATLQRSMSADAGFVGLVEQLLDHGTPPTVGWPAIPLGSTQRDGHCGRHHVLRAAYSRLKRIRRALVPNRTYITHLALLLRSVPPAPR